MSIAVFVTNESDATSLIPWGIRFACADHSELLIVCPKKSKGKHAWELLDLNDRQDSALDQTIFEILKNQDPDRVVLKQSVREDGESTEMSRVVVETRELVAPNPVSAFVDEVANLHVGLLLISESEYSKGPKLDESVWAQKLFRDAPCQVAIINGKPDNQLSKGRILVACQGQTSGDDHVAVERACQLAAECPEGQVTLLYVRPDDDLVAYQVAEKHLKQLLRTDYRSVEIHKQIQLADSFGEGIVAAGHDDYELVLIGSRNSKTIRTVFRDLSTGENPTSVSVATIRQSVPLAVRIWSRIRNSIRSIVPQLDRDRRVSLVDQLQSSSKFDFDFIALISLSTLIAALGLARNSGAVVIGAMLVAPLMTPLVGMGFALVQGNEKLVQNAWKSVVLGFTVALGIGFCLGAVLQVVAPHLEVTGQMKDRDMPNLLDLVVALASGVAGAYAMGRPNLVSALPGVAIAAALVPPIATSGLALSMGDFSLATGALFLFLTNIVTIVLGTAITFWSVGISTRRVPDKNRPLARWPQYWFFGFVVLSFLLAAAMSILNPLDPSPKSDLQPENPAASVPADDL